VLIHQAVRFGALFFAALPALAAMEQSCDISGGPLLIGKDTDFVLCGNELPEDSIITMLDSDVARVVYVQRLQRCNVNDKRKGFHVVLNASQSGETRLRVVDATTTADICGADLTAVANPDSSTPTWLNSMPQSDARYIDVNGIRTRYFEKGSGPALVLVHGGQAGGSNNSAEKCEQNYNEFSHTYRVIALDRLAQAYTDNLSSSEDYSNYFALDAKHLEDFIVELGIKDATLVGHSQGGWPVTWLALKRPDLVSCVVNVDTVMVPDNMELMGDALAFMIHTYLYVDPPTGPTVHSSRRAMAMRYPTGKNITDAKSQRVVGQFQMPKTVDARKHMSALRMTPQNPAFKKLRDEVYEEIAAGKFEVRSLVVWGEKDPQVPLGLGEEFNQILLDGNVETKLAVIEGAGHAPFVELPEEFNELVIDYCAR
jgi:2-hydroxy-6-oxonona-2,4-dienedioate hydrolase